MAALYENWAAGEATKNTQFWQRLAQPEFWKVNTIRIEMMNRIADSGDILLFTCNDFMSGV